MSNGGGRREKKEEGSGISKVGGSREKGQKFRNLGTIFLKLKRWKPV